MSLDSSTKLLIVFGLIAVILAGFWYYNNGGVLPFAESGKCSETSDCSKLGSGYCWVDYPTCACQTCTCSMFSGSSCSNDTYLLDKDGTGTYPSCTESYTNCGNVSGGYCYDHYKDRVLSGSWCACESSSVCSGNSVVTKSGDWPSCTTTTTACSVGYHCESATCVKTPYCGDGNCDSNESKISCLTDCPYICPDSVCDSNETTSTCSADCPLVDSCGDGICGKTESVTSCKADCQICGDGECNGDETYEMCSEDCPKPIPPIPPSSAPLNQTIVVKTQVESEPIAQDYVIAGGAIIVMLVVTLFL